MAGKTRKREKQDQAADAANVTDVPGGGGASKPKKVLLGLAAAVILAGGGYFLFGPGFGPTGALIGADPTDQELVAVGRTVYGERCASCHGANLEGEANWRSRKPDGTLPAPPHDQTGHTWHHPDRMLFDYTKLGGAGMGIPGFKSAMPGFQEILKDGEIRAVLAFIKSRWPEPVLARQRQINLRNR